VLTEKNSDLVRVVGLQIDRNAIYERWAVSFTSYYVMRQHDIRSHFSMEGVRMAKAVPEKLNQACYIGICTATRHVIIPPEMMIHFIGKVTQVPEVDKNFCHNAPKKRVPRKYLGTKYLRFKKLINSLALHLNANPLQNFQVFHYFWCLSHLAFAASRAISLRLLAERLSDRAFPPFNPPSRPRATAAGFFSPLVLAATMSAAI
jgi:hypothetical protein